MQCVRVFADALLKRRGKPIVWCWPEWSTKGLLGLKGLIETLTEIDVVFPLTFKRFVLLQHVCQHM